MAEGFLVTLRTLPSYPQRSGRPLESCGDLIWLYLAPSGGRVENARMKEGGARTYRLREDTSLTPRTLSKPWVAWSEDLGG